MNGKLPISLVVITKNEAHNIARCLEAADFCAEQLVVDSGSTDETVPIAEACGARVLHRDWTGYGDQKNFGGGQAAHEWILCIDADEVVTPELRDSIRRAFAEPPTVDGFEINRHGLYGGKLINHSGWYPEWRLFLYRKGRARWGGLEPHATVEFSGTGRRRLDGDLLHYTYADIGEHLRKSIQAARDAAVALHRAGRRPTAYDILLRPVWAAFRRYFLQQGFRDGVRGVVIAKIAGMYTFLKYAYLWELRSRDS